MRSCQLLGVPFQPGPEAVGVVRDMAYGDDAAHRLDLYRVSSRDPTPVIVYVHGGGWQRGDKAMTRVVGRKAQHWLARGWAVAVINYRLFPETDVLGQAEDVGRSLAFLQREASVHNLDRGRIALVGHSAGAHLVALLAANPQRMRTMQPDPWQSTVIIDTAMLDVPGVMRRPHFGFYDPVFGSDPDYWRAASPLHAMQRAPATPILIVVSARRADSRRAAEAFARRAVELGGRVCVLPVRLGHAALNQALGSDPVYTAAVDRFLQNPERQAAAGFGILEDS